MRQSLIVAGLITFLAAPVGAAAVSHQSDADDKRDREVQQLQKELSKLEDRYDKLLKRCSGGYNRPDRRACDNARVTYSDIQELKKQIAKLSQSSG